MHNTANLNSTCTVHILGKSRVGYFTIMRLYSLLIAAVLAYFKLIVKLSTVLSYKLNYITQNENVS